MDPNEAGPPMSSVSRFPLVAEDSKLRALPVALDTFERMRIDAIIYASDAISANWKNLRSIAASTGKDLGRLSHFDRSAMISSAWSIVDELDCLRQIVRSFYKKDSEIGPKAQAFLNSCEKVRFLRT